MTITNMGSGLGTITINGQTITMDELRRFREEKKGGGEPRPSSSSCSGRSAPPTDPSAPVTSDEKLQMLLVLTGVQDQDGDEDDEGDVCVICADKKRIITPQCGHRQLCAGCAIELVRGNDGSCPLCRAKIRTVIRVFD
jgi:hypothetical protein